MNKIAVLAAAASFTGGAVAGYIVAQKRLEKVYDEIARAEIAQAKEFYAVINKKDVPSPTVLAEEKGYSADAAHPTLRDAAESLLVYKGEVELDVEQKEILDAHTSRTVTEIIEEDGVVQTNVFQESVSIKGWNQEEEESERTDSAPYIISWDEFKKNQPDYIQTVLTYFEADGVLVDEKDVPIDQTDMTVGDGALTRFGHGSRDNNIVYVRNPVLDMDFEIVRTPKSYEEEVLGIQHSHRPRSRRFRDDDE